MIDGKIEKLHVDEYKERKNADRLIEIAGKLNRSAGKIDQLKMHLLRGWESPSTSEYIAKMNCVEEKIQGDAHELRKIAEQINCIVSKTIQAEEEAKYIVQQRTDK